MPSPESPEPGPNLEDFSAGEPTRSLTDWRWLWEGDRTFPIRSHRGWVGKLVVRLKCWLRPFVKAPLNDLWDRQRSFNLVLLAHLEELHAGMADLRRNLQRDRDDLLRDLREVRDDLLRDVRNNHRRLTHLEAFKREGFEDVMRHTDALFALVDQKMDRYRRDTRQLGDRLGGLLARVETVTGGQSPSEAEALAHAWSEQGYLDLEERFRGTAEEIAERVGSYLPYLTGRGEILDLGCGRGEMLAVLRDHDLTARGIDSSGEMVRRCRAQGLEAEEGDLFEALAATPEASLGAIVSLHVIEHLPATAIGRLVRLAWLALKPGGVLILETPSPLSLTVAARNFWLDPTHCRPVHPETLELTFEAAGFDAVERLDLRPFSADERLPEIGTVELPEELQGLAYQINRLRDRLDGLLFGYQDYGVVGTKP
ncbi:MAG: class I SAM-dependent methyltransferase [Thermoanaerobaculia bacterium]